MTRYTFGDSGLPKQLWGEVLQAAAYLANRVAHSGLDMDTLFKKLWGNDANLQHLQVLGVGAFVNIEGHTPQL